MKSILKNVTWIVLTIVLCIGMSGIISLAADKEASVDIISKNVYYGETLNLMYAVDAQNLSEGDEVQIVLTKGGKNVAISYYKTQTVNGVDALVYKADKGVAPQNIDDVYTAKAQIVNNGEVVAENSTTEPTGRIVINYNY